MCSHGLSFVRLDAFAYAVKKAGTDCFFVEPEIWELLHAAENVVEPYGVQILPEIHEHYTIQLKIADKGFWVYDFALPMLLLHALYTGRPDRLLNWFTICPRKQFTTLDTHDGIGVVDVVGLSDRGGNRRDKTLLLKGANVKKKYKHGRIQQSRNYQIKLHLLFGSRQQ
jgi:sucrose phosphorylase